MLALFLTVLFELCLSFQVQNLGLTFSGSTWQRRLLSRFLVEGIVWKMDPLQGENLGSDHAG
jgi:hypothetical protein